MSKLNGKIQWQLQYQILINNYKFQKAILTLHNFQY